MTPFTPKPRTKLEFARLFVSEKEMSDRSARNWLLREITSNAQLLTQLENWGWTRSTKTLTIMQQRLIWDSLCSNLAVKWSGVTAECGK